jgi:hypothetical protein
LNEAAYYRATLTNNTFGTSTWFQGFTWSISSSGSTSVGPIASSTLSTAGSGNSVTWSAPSPWTPGISYIWEGRFGNLPTLSQISDIGYSNLYRVQQFQVGTNVSAGNVFSVGVYSVTVSYVAQAGDTVNDVVDGLVNAVNNTSTATWDTYGSAPIGNPYFPPQAYVLSSSTFSITLNWQNSFGYSASIS